MIPKVRKAVFPAAGLGTRFLPATKAQPKEMLPLVDKPLIQYGVEEAIQRLDEIMGRKNKYPIWVAILVHGCAAASADIACSATT